MPKSNIINSSNAPTDNHLKLFVLLVSLIKSMFWCGQNDRRKTAPGHEICADWGKTHNKPKVGTECQEHPAHPPQE
jgi:hypothetical protein